jgi:hypothetical protein
MIKKAYLKLDIDKETIFKIWAPTRLEAAKRLASRKNLTLKQFLNIYGIK